VLPTLMPTGATPSRTRRTNGVCQDGELPQQTKAYSPECVEQVFSETHIQLNECLCVRTGAECLAEGLVSLPRTQPLRP
jgi:hypothetical protein